MKLLAQKLGLGEQLKKEGFLDQLIDEILEEDAGSGWSSADADADARGFAGGVAGGGGALANGLGAGGVVGGGGPSRQVVRLEQLLPWFLTTGRRVCYVAILQSKTKILLLKNDHFYTGATCRNRYTRPAPTLKTHPMRI